ncbi:hypothetical protein AX284_10505 [Pseudomonas sp. HUK17]|nr:hypothetical protein AX284_10505 [Pseudomonas sp. HUK17]
MVRLLPEKDLAQLGSLSTTPGLGRGGALGLDAFQQHAGRFVIRVLGHQFAAEGFGEDALGQTINAHLGGFDTGFELVGEGEELFDAADDFGLFFI